MSDTRNKAKRREIMKAVSNKNTWPEVRLRKALHAEGFRYVLHKNDLPGRPDIVFPKYRKIIFVHGCFWHWHGCKYGQPPKSNQEYWVPKLSKNIQRDEMNVNALKDMGWDVAVFWQCEIRRNPDNAVEQAKQFLIG